MTTTATSAPSRPRLAFAGLGWIGKHRMTAVADSHLADVAWLCDPLDDSTLSFDEILAGDADAIVIATPSALHAEQSIAALERGKAVFCQKPLGRNAAECRRVVDAARANDRLLGVDLSYRFTDGVRAVHDLVRSGEIGDVYAVELTFHNAWGPDKPWFYDAKLSGGGCVIDLGIHLVDLALWTLGFPRVEHVTSRLFHHGGHDVEDFATARIDVAGGAALQIACSWNLSAGQECVLRAIFYGTHGAAAFRNVNGSFYDFVAERYDRTQTTCLTEPGEAWGGRAIVDWTARLAESRAFDPAIERIVDVAACLDQIYQAAGGPLAARTGAPRRARSSGQP